MELKGKIINVLEERSGVAKSSGRPYRVAQYVLETIEQYPKKMMFEIFGEERIKQMNIQANEELTISFDIDSREYNGKWYNQIRAWKVERQEAPTISHDSALTDNSTPFPPISDSEEFPTDKGVLPF